MNQPPSPPPPLTVQTAGPEQTRRVGSLIGRQARAGDVFLLSGPLGAGKTCLTQGIAAGLGVEGYVRSPTFVLMTRHQGRLTLHHLDLYRIGGPEEAWDLGLDEQLFGEGVCVIEWAERAASVLPPEALWVELDYAPGEEQRTLTFPNAPARYAPLLQSLAAAAGAPGLGGANAGGSDSAGPGFEGDDWGVADSDNPVFVNADAGGVASGSPGVGGVDVSGVDSGDLGVGGADVGGADSGVPGFVDADAGGVDSGGVDSGSPGFVNADVSVADSGGPGFVDADAGGVNSGGPGVGGVGGVDADGANSGSPGFVNTDVSGTDSGNPGLGGVDVSGTDSGGPGLGVADAGGTDSGNLDSVNADVSGEDADGNHPGGGPPPGNAR